MPWRYHRNEIKSDWTRDALLLSAPFQGLQVIELKGASRGLQASVYGLIGVSKPASFYFCKSFDSIYNSVSNILFYLFHFLSHFTS